MSAQATPEEIATVVAAAQTWPDAYVARRVILHLAGEVAALRRQVEERGDAAPEFDVNRLDGLEGAWAEGNLRVYIAGARAGWEKCASLIRISPGDVVATPPPDVVPVPREKERRTWRDFSAGWAAARRSTPRQSSDEECAVRDGLASAWIEALNGIDALRSGEAGKGAG